MTDAHKLDRYVEDASPVVRERIEEWRDLKFGLLMHWGTYSQLGLIESWPICPEDEGWCLPPTVDNYDSFKTMYESLPYTFNPTKFDPERWAAAAKDAGMKYLVFTTKHHDGFCMFDSQYTDYKITNERVPFSKDPRADVTQEIFDAFRDEDMWIGAYFSKPDWNSEDFWWPRFPAKDRNPNYDVERYPERWQDFVDFTHNQVMELVEDYGGIDLLWFDGGWVKKTEYSDEALPEVPAGYKLVKEPNLDIKMDELVEKVRDVNPDLIVVDRAVPGKNQNYLTPENQVPNEMLPYPWESCIILGGGWSYSLDAEFKSSRELIHLLSDIVAKGGNLLLNIGPGPAGTWYESAYQRLEDIGDWMDINSDSIYETRVVAPYFDGKLRFTQGKAGEIYATYLLDEGEESLPKSIDLGSLEIPAGASVSILGAEGSGVKLSGSKLVLKKDQQSSLPSPYAVVFKIVK
ncbi:alpha-L-fucosidase [Pelagicoccus albus]|uniref:alpha-L-fucosidase n=2 Tax=Pelagicoccus albus TaxID=415222 RepID=A0A7X1B891_9BACT|nr:alpha-L-fucosidase [Pelagicoccus albus]